MKAKNLFFKIKPVLLAGLFSVVLGCGYAFAPQGEHIDTRIKRIYVEPFANKTAQAEIENFMRTAFIDQILQNSRFKTVADIEQADAVISGKVLNLNTTALSYRKSILAAEERMTVILEVSFREKESGKTLWSSRSVSMTVDYELQDDINLLPATRKRALAKLSRDTAEKAFSMMMTNF
jgi:outer membrane lipopolysaccharide assembly protein LptE/RlpB